MQSHPVQRFRPHPNADAGSPRPRKRQRRYRVTLDDLPNELLAAIFVQSLPPHLQVHHDFAPRDPYSGTPARPVTVYAAPLVVSWVCTRWRNVALATPSLWTSVPLCILDGCPLNKEHDSSRALVAAGKLDTFAGRAGELPLSVEIGCSHVSSPQLSESFEPVVWALEQLPTFNNIRLLNVHIAENALRAFASYARDRLDFSNLTALSLLFPRGSGLDEWAIEMFRHLPKLRSLALDSVSLNRLPDLPWSSLTEFSGDGYGLVDVLNVLRQAPNLRRASFDIMPRSGDLYPWNTPDPEEEVFRDSPEENERITLDHLEEFSAHEGCEGYSHVLEHLRLPALRTLTLGISSSWGTKTTAGPDETPESWAETIKDPDTLHPAVLNVFLRSSGTLHLQKLVLLSTWRHANWPKWANDPFRELRVTDAVFGGVVPSFVSPFFSGLQYRNAFLPCLERLEIRCHERDEDERRSSEDGDEDDSSAPDSAFEAVLAVAGEAILARNARSSASNGSDPSRIHSFKLFSDGTDEEMYRIDKPMLDFRRITALQRSGVEVVIASEDMKFRVA